MKQTNDFSLKLKLLIRMICFN